MTKKLSIAVFYNLYQGGALKVLQDNVKFLKKEGHHVDVYTFDVYDNTFAPFKEFVDNYYIYPVKKSKIRNFIFSSLNKLISSINIPDTSSFYYNFNQFVNVQKNMAKDIDNKDYDLVFLEQDVLFTSSPAILKYLKKPTIFYCQEPIRSNEKILKKLSFTQNTIYDKLFSKFILNKQIKRDIEYAQYADEILVNSFYSHENIMKVYGLNSHVCYLGIDNKAYCSKEIPRENFILSVGNIAEHKGFDFIIRSVGKINKNIRPKLIINGYSSHWRWKNYLIQLAKDEDVDLEILEGISFDELVELYNKAKLFVFGSILEPFGLVSLEALSCGTPVVAVKEGGIREIIKHNENGFLIERDEKLFARAIVELMQNNELWEKFSENGIEYVDENWSLNRTGQFLLDNFYRFLKDYD